MSKWKCAEDKIELATVDQISSEILTNQNDWSYKVEVTRILFQIILRFWLTKQDFRLIRTCNCSTAQADTSPDIWLIQRNFTSPWDFAIILSSYFRWHFCTSSNPIFAHFFILLHKKLLIEKSRDLVVINCWYLLRKYYVIVSFNEEIPRGFNVCWPYQTERCHAMGSRSHAARDKFIVSLVVTGWWVAFVPREYLRRLE